MKKLNDVFLNWLSGGGIFSSLQNYGVPWKNENIALKLDLEYHGNISGQKYISPLLESLIDGDAISTIEKQTLSETLIAIYGINWTKQWATLSAQYNPIQNYDMTETMTNDVTEIEYGKINTTQNNLSHTKTGTETNVPDVSNARTVSLEERKTGTETEEPNLTETQTPNLTNTTDNGVFGFNSSSASNSDTQIETTTGTNTNRRTGTDQTTFNTTVANSGTDTVRKTGTETTTYNTTDANTGTQTNTDSGSDTHTRNYELHRVGNIGVTTSQQMLESERNLWIWNYFHSVVFPDVNRVLTIQIY